MRHTFTLLDNDHEEFQIELPARWAICDHCDGHGKVDNPAFDEGWTASEWSQEDDEFKQDYMGGRYDVRCDECSGSGKVVVPNVSSLTFTQKRLIVTDRKMRREIARLDHEAAMEAYYERRMGC